MTGNRRNREIRKDNFQDPISIAVKLLWDSREPFSHFVSLSERQKNTDGDHFCPDDVSEQVFSVVPEVSKWKDLYFFSLVPLGLV